MLRPPGWGEHRKDAAAHTAGAHSRKIQVSLRAALHEPGVIIAGQPVTAHAVNLIQNGDFEISVPSNATGGGWTTFGSIDGSGGWRSTGATRMEISF